MKAVAALVGIFFAIGFVTLVVGLVGSLLATLVTAVRVKWIPVIYNVRSLTRRKVTTLFTVLGMALVVFVFSTVLMLRSGIRETLVSGGRVDNAVVLRKGAPSEITSVVERDQAKLLASRDEVAVDPEDGKPLADPQVAVLIFAQRPGALSTDGANVFVRGLSERMLALHPNIKVSRGRWFQPGTSEVVIGKALVGKFVGAELGSDISFARRNWKVVGVIDAGGSSFDSEVWLDAEQCMASFQRTMYSTLTMRVKDAAQIPAIAESVAADPRLNLDVKDEHKYFEDLSNGLSNLLSFIGLFVAVVFSLGATLGAMISMYAQVAARIREVGTLRALGFRRSSVLVSFVIESILLGLLAGVIGVAASALMEFASFSTMNFTTFSEVTFRFTLTSRVVVSSMIFSGIMGYAGGLMPAVRAARMPIVEATRG